MWRPKGSERDYGWTAALGLLALAARVAFAVLVPQPPAWDGVLYERAARGIASGLGYTSFMFVHRASDTLPTAFYPVGYPAFLAAVYAVFGAHAAAMRIAGAVVGALAVVVTHRLAFRVSPGWAARAAALGLALMPGQVMFASAAMTETLFGLLLALAVYAVVRREPGPRALDLCVLGVLVAAATYVRPQAVLIAPVLALVRAPDLAIGGWRARCAAAALATTVALACVLPWTARNCARLDACAFVSTNGGANLAIGALPGARGTYRVLAAADGCPEAQGEVAHDRCWRDAALRAIREHPGGWIALAVPKLAHTLAYEAFPVGYLRRSGAVAMDDARERTLQRWITAPWRLLLALALLATLPLRRRSRLPPAARASLASVVALLATHAVFFGGDRYHLPMVPLLCVLAAGAFREFSTGQSTRATRRSQNAHSSQKIV